MSFFAAAPAHAQTGPEFCGSVQNAFGPYDYRTDRDKLGIVEGSHFTPEVEALIRGKSAYLGGDIDYTLRAFPNHARALVSMMRYGQRMKTAKPPNATYTVECYFDRALRFRPHDATVRMLYADYLLENQRASDAEQQLAIAVNQAGDNDFTHYNAGLLYLKMKNYPKALEQAQAAYGLGFARPQLRDALKATGNWVEPPADAASAAVTPAASAASTSAAAVLPASTASGAGR